MPLRNNTISKRIDSMAQDAEGQLVRQLKEKNLLCSSTNQQLEMARLYYYVRFVYNGKICEEMIFCDTLPTDSKALSIFQAVNNYPHNISITSIVSRVFLGLLHATFTIFIRQIRNKYVYVIALYKKEFFV